MANSDNVLRGGLTSKHIDVGELMKHVLFEPVIPRLLHAAPSTGSFEIPVDDFRLRQLSIGNGSRQPLRVKTASILLCMKGSVELRAGERTILLKQGQPSALLMPDQDIVIKALSDALLFSATTGFHSR
jgi:mannose-6-phosphate isomerase